MLIWLPVLMQHQLLTDIQTDGRTEMLRAPHEAVVLTRDIS